MKSGGWALIFSLAIGKILRHELCLSVLRVFVNIAKKCSLIGWSVIVKKMKLHLHLGHEELRKNIVETESLCQTAARCRKYRKPEALHRLPA